MSAPPAQAAVNRVELSVSLVERAAPRYTPAGLPALDMQVQHASQIEEAGQMRQVQVQMKAVAFGTVAERLGRQAVGSALRVEGFLASPRQGRHPVLHIQAFQIL